MDERCTEAMRTRQSQAVTVQYGMAWHGMAWHRGVCQVWVRQNTFCLMDRQLGNKHVLYSVSLDELSGLSRRWS